MTRRQARRRARRMRYNLHRSAFSGLWLSGALVRRHLWTWQTQVALDAPASRWYRHHIEGRPPLSWYLQGIEARP